MKLPSIRNLGMLSRLSKWVILFNVLDVFTTLIGIYLLGATEKNPIANLVGLEGLFVIKFFAVLISIYVIEKYKLYKLWVALLIACVPLIAVIWNTTNIIVEIVYATTQ